MISYTFYTRLNYSIPRTLELLPRTLELLPRTLELFRSVLLNCYCNNIIAMLIHARQGWRLTVNTLHSTLVYNGTNLRFCIYKPTNVICTLFSRYLCFS